jgi:hypothetical protein
MYVFNRGLLFDERRGLTTTVHYGVSGFWVWFPSIGKEELLSRFFG